MCCLIFLSRGRGRQRREVRDPRHCSFTSRSRHSSRHSLYHSHRTTLPEASVFVAGAERQPPISLDERLVRGRRLSTKTLAQGFFFLSPETSPLHTALKNEKAKPFFFPSFPFCMHPLPLVARTRNDTNQSARAAQNPSSSPPPLRAEEARGPEGEQQTRDGEEEEAKQPPPPPPHLPSQPQLLETEKLRAGIQHLLSSAPAPSAQSQQQKRQEATPRRRATPRRAGASSATKKTPASALASIAVSGNSSSSRPYKAQLALFSVSKPAQLPFAAKALRARAVNEGMEDQVSRLIGK